MLLLIIMHFRHRCDLKTKALGEEGGAMTSHFMSLLPSDRCDNHLDCE